MNSFFVNRKKHDQWFLRGFTAFLLITFSSSMVIPPNVYSQSLFNLPAPGTMVPPSARYIPSVLKGIKVFPDHPFRFDFIVDSGDSDSQKEEFKLESTKLIKYFLAALTVPEEDQWVNLSPHEPERIIPDALSMTEMGRDMLAQDYLLKQLTASLIYPEDPLGQQFWSRMYQKAEELYETTDIPVNTFNKVWVIPEKAVVHESGQTAFIIEGRLKIILESDYLALNQNQSTPYDDPKDFPVQNAQPANEFSSDIVRKVILPEIEHEVNHGENFAPLRQIYHSLILAAWFKRNLKESILNKVYVGHNKVNGLEIEDKNIREKIYQQYLEAYKKGVYEYIREDINPVTHEIIPRKYFSGGENFSSEMIDAALVVAQQDPVILASSVGAGASGNLQTVSAVLEPDHSDRALLSFTRLTSFLESNELFEGREDVFRLLLALQRNDGDLLEDEDPISESDRRAIMPWLGNLDQYRNKQFFMGALTSLTSPLGLTDFFQSALDRIDALVDEVASRPEPATPVTTAVGEEQSSQLSSAQVLALSEVLGGTDSNSPIRRLVVAVVTDNITALRPNARPRSARTIPSNWDGLRQFSVETARTMIQTASADHLWTALEEIESLMSSTSSTLLDLEALATFLNPMGRYSEGQSVVWQLLNLILERDFQGHVTQRISAFREANRLTYFYRNPIDDLEVTNVLGELSGLSIEDFRLTLQRLRGVLDREGIGHVLDSWPDLLEELRSLRAGLREEAIAAERREIEQRLSQMEEYARNGTSSLDTTPERRRAISEELARQAQRLELDDLVQRAQALPALFEEQERESARISSNYLNPLGEALDFLGRFDLSHKNHLERLVSMRQLLQEISEPLAAEEGESGLLAMARERLGRLRQQLTEVRAQARGSLDSPEMETQQQPEHRAQTERLLAKLEASESINEEVYTAERRIPWEDWKAVEDIFQVLKESIERRNAPGYRRQEYAEKLSDVIRSWNSHEDSMKRQILEKILIARGWERGDVQEAAEWLRQFFRIYHHSFYLSPETAASQGGIGIYVLGRIVRVIPVRWKSFQRVIYVDPIATNVDAGGRPTTNRDEVMVVLNQKRSSSWSAEISALHEAQHLFNAIESAELGVRYEIWELEYLAYVVTMLEIGRGWVNRHPERAHLTIAEVFGDEKVMRDYVQSGEDTMAHVAATNYFRPRFTGRVMELMDYRDKSHGAITLDFLIQRPGLLEEYWNIVAGPRGSPTMGQHIMQAAQAMFEEFYREKLGFIPAYPNVLELETLEVARPLQDPEVYRLLEEVAADPALMTNGGQARVATPEGGIDFKSEFDLEVEGDGLDFDFPVSSLPCLDQDGDGRCDQFNAEEIENLPINSLTPIILKIGPTNLPALLGVSVNTIDQNRDA